MADRKEAGALLEEPASSGLSSLPPVRWRITCDGHWHPERVG
jgi:hypothetical protein